MRSVVPADTPDDVGDLLRRLGHLLVASVGGAGRIALRHGLHRGRHRGRGHLRARPPRTRHAPSTRRRRGSRGGAAAAWATRRSTTRCGRPRTPSPTAIASGEGRDVAIMAALRAARDGMEATTPLVARRGLALRLGERSRGHQDPGATSCYLLCRALLASGSARLMAQLSGTAARHRGRAPPELRGGPASGGHRLRSVPAEPAAGARRRPRPHGRGRHRRAGPRERRRRGCHVARARPATGGLRLVRRPSLDPRRGAGLSPCPGGFATAAGSGRLGPRPAAGTASRSTSAATSATGELGAADGRVPRAAPGGRGAAAGRPRPPAGARPPRAGDRLPGRPAARGARRASRRSSPRSSTARPRASSRSTSDDAWCGSTGPPWPLLGRHGCRRPGRSCETVLRCADPGRAAVRRNGAGSRRCSVDRRGTGRGGAAHRPSRTATEIPIAASFSAMAGPRARRGGRAPRPARRAGRRRSCGRASSRRSRTSSGPRSRSSRAMSTACSAWAWTRRPQRRSVERIGHGRRAPPGRWWTSCWTSPSSSTRASRLHRSRVDVAGAARHGHRRPGRVARDAAGPRRRCPPGLPPVHVDAVRIGHVLVNLVDNARRYGGTPVPIRVRAGRRRSVVVVTVEDGGPGIPPGRAGARVRPPVPGPGRPRRATQAGPALGLHVCRRLVEAHGGRIWIEPEAGS